MNPGSSLRSAPAITYVMKRLSVFPADSYLHVTDILTTVPVTLLCYMWFILGSSPSESASLSQSDVARHQMQKYLSIRGYKTKPSCSKKSWSSINRKKKIGTTSLKICSSGNTFFSDPLLLFLVLWPCDQNRSKSWDACYNEVVGSCWLTQWVQLTKAMNHICVFLPPRTFSHFCHNLTPI